MPCPTHSTGSEPACKLCVKADLLAEQKEVDYCGEHDLFFDAAEGCPKCIEKFSDRSDEVERIRYARPAPRNNLGNAIVYEGFYNRLAAICTTKYRRKSRIAPLLDLLEVRPTVSPARVLATAARVRTVKKSFVKSVNKKYGTVLNELETAVRGKLRLHRRQSFYQHLHIGAENELGETTICLLQNSNSKPANIGYGQVIAATKASSDVADIPLVELQVEGAGQGDEHSGPSGIIEHIGGPLSPHDVHYASSREALSIFHEVLANPGITWSKSRDVDKVGRNLHPLSDWLAEYNHRIDLKGDPRLALFKLVINPREGATWWLRGEASGTNTQVNFEAPLRNLLEPGFLALYDPRGENVRILTKAAELAKARVRTVTGSDAPALLTAAMTMFYYWRTVAYNQAKRNKLTGQTASAHEAKNKYELMPKAPMNDILRVAMTDREKQVLARHVSQDLTRWQKRVNDDLQLCIKGSDPYNRAADTELLASLPNVVRAVFLPGAGDRYANETGTAYGDEVKKLCKKTKRCVRPDDHRGKCVRDNDQAAVARLDSANFPLGPRAGRPCPVQLHYVGDGQDLEPVIVFECRSTDHAIAQLGKAFKKKDTEEEDLDDDLDGLGALVSAVTVDNLTYNER